MCGGDAHMSYEDQHAPLTPAERCTLARLIEGHEPKQIAAVRGVKPRTVRNQIASIHRKLDLSRTYPSLTGASRTWTAAFVPGKLRSLTARLMSNFVHAA
jgi:DNA-binding CsgD family transcriptional regulator